MPDKSSSGPLLDEDIASAKPACVALVPLNPASERPNQHGWRWSPDASFVTHLMACARQAPQTCRMRRASVADAQSAYCARQTPAALIGSRTRQIV